MNTKLIGDNIRILRENAGFTQSSIAAFVKVDQSLISKAEKGERNLSVDVLEKLSALFGVTLEQLESQPIVASKLSFAFRGSEFSVEEMEAISTVNRIALNLGFMDDILRGRMD